MDKETKKIRAQLILEHIVHLSTQKLYGYRVLSRLITSEREKLSFAQIGNIELKRKLELGTLRNAVNISQGNSLFINVPVALEIDSLHLYGSNFVVCLPMDLSLKKLIETQTKLKNSKLRSALDDFYTVGHETKGMKLGAFEFVFVKDDFYMNAKKSDLIKVVFYLKSFGARVIFKKVDTYKKVELAAECGADYGHGYFFGYEAYDLVLE